MNAVKIKVLVVEDNQATAGAILRWLKAAGFTVEHALAAQEGIAAAADFRPDVILLDLQIPSGTNLPDKDVEHGFRTLDALLAADPFRPVCVVTAHSKGELVRRAVQKTRGGPFVFKDAEDLQREVLRAVDVALAGPAYKMSKTVREFRALVDKNEPEDVYRKFIHQHWGAILGPEYQDVRSPYTVTRGGEIDLLAIRWDGFPDLWELKRPAILSSRTTTAGSTTAWSARGRLASSCRTTTPPKRSRKGRSGMMGDAASPYTSTARAASS